MKTPLHLAALLVAVLTLAGCDDGGNTPVDDLNSTGIGDMGESRYVLGRACWSKRGDRCIRAEGSRSVRSRPRDGTRQRC